MLTIATVVTRGFGAWGSIGYVVRRGYSGLDTNEYASAGYDLCGRCGVRYPDRRLKKEWTGLRVCFGPGTNKCWEPRHPQQLVRGRLDRQTVPGARPEPDPIYLDTNDVQPEDL